VEDEEGSSRKRSPSKRDSEFSFKWNNYLYDMASKLHYMLARETWSDGRLQAQTQPGLTHDVQMQGRPR